MPQLAPRTWRRFPISSHKLTNIDNEITERNTTPERGWLRVYHPCFVQARSLKTSRKIKSEYTSSPCVAWDPTLWSRGVTAFRVNYRESCFYIDSTTYTCTISKHESADERCSSCAHNKSNTGRIRRTQRAYIRSKCNLTPELRLLIMQAEVLIDDLPKIQLSF